MTDAAAPAIDNQTPTNPYSLLEAVNRASRSASLAWLALLAVLAYVTATVAGISHRDLLLDGDVVLPLLQSKIGLTRFFMLAPLLLVALHLAVIGQMALVARKTLEFASAIRLLEVSDERAHPLRHELDTFFLVQAIAGPERSRVISAFLHGLGWLTLALLPLALLLYIQLAFLPYHSLAITTLHRVAVLVDLVGLALVGVFLLRSETSLLRAFVRLGRNHVLGALLVSLGFAVIACSSLLLATIPGERLDRYDLLTTARLQSALLPSALAEALPALGRAFGSDAAVLPRNLIVSDLDLTAGKGASAGRPSLSLRGRDLRFAKFDRSDLRSADLSGANLDAASFVDADLRHASLGCLEPASQAADGRRGSACTSARAANLARARLSGANLSGIDLSQANLEGAELQDAQLEAAVLTAGNLARARLERASFAGGAQLRGAKFAGTTLQGADLSGAQLQLADFSNARMHGADLSGASLEGALLRNAELEGANLQRSALYAADFAGARLAGADLTAALVWRTLPPLSDPGGSADWSQIALRLPRDQELTQLSAYLAADEALLEASQVQRLLRAASLAELRAWTGSPEQQAWQGLAKPREANEADQYKARLTGYLTRLMCQWRFSDGSVAAGIARRAMAPGFKGDVSGIYERLKSADCPAGQNINPRLLRELGVAVERARAQD
jgi:uncharacterized protein YjbI with pentapeptide repeats